MSIPRAAIDASGAAGVLGLLSATDVGGGGGSLADVADVVETIAGACGSTAMVVLMHYAATVGAGGPGPREVREAVAGGGHLTHAWRSRRPGRAATSGRR